MSSKRSAVKPCVKGTKWSHVASLLEMEQKGLGDTKNSLGLVHKLFFTVLCSIFVTRLNYHRRLFFWTMPPGHPANLSEVRTTSGCHCCLHAFKHITFSTNGPGTNSNH